MKMRRARAIRVVLAAAALAAAGPVLAIQAGPHAARDRTRFGSDHPYPKLRKGHLASSTAAFAKFNAAAGKTWKLRFSPRTGIPTSLVGGPDTPRYGTPQQIGLSFINAHPDILGLDPTTLTYERQTTGNGHSSVLFRQKYKGLPVEFAAVKVHMAADGSVLGLHSSYEPNITVPTSPTVTAAAATTDALNDAGGGKPFGTPTLVILPSETDGLAHLAWKLTINAPGASWHYYVDALNGAILLRFNNHEFISGTITGQVYNLDPIGTSAPIAGAFDNEYVYLGLPPYTTSGANPNQLVTGATGAYSSALNYPMSTSLQGPYVSVAEFRGASAHYDNGPGLWQQCSTVAASPSPYQFGYVYASTLTASGCSNAPATMIPRFSSFKVGQFDDDTSVTGEGGALTQDDQLGVYDPNGNVLGSYVGCVGCTTPPPSVFSNTLLNGYTGYADHGAESHGAGFQLNLAAKGGSNVGYTIAASSSLYYTNPVGPGALPSSHEWTSSDTFTAGVPGTSFDCPTGSGFGTCPNLHGELSLFYHLNQMHDFFTYGYASAGYGGAVSYTQNSGTLGQANYGPGVNSCTAGPTCPGGAYAPLPGPVAAMVHVGPDLLNAFFDPDFDDLFFGDGRYATPSDAFVDDATVPHHEYTHYIVNKIWPLVNFGQAGTISEANADYFSASSLNDPNIGSFVNYFYGNGPSYTPLRALDCSQNPPCYDLGTNPGWTGEIHADSPFVSQALWEIRKTMGQQCADNLEFQALLFFPESFAELVDALEAVDHLGTVASCGGAGHANSAIVSAFGTHIPDSVSQSGEDAYEPNDGFDTATDISTITTLNATIYPIADQDYYSFGAGPGLITATLKLPLISGYPLTYSGFQMFLFDSGHNQVATVAPPYDGIGTADGECLDGNLQQGSNQTISGCTTTQQTISMSYQNPSGQLMFVEVVGGTYSNSPSDVYNANPYTLTLNYTRASALSAGIVTATYSNDVISFAVNVATYTTSQPYTLNYVQLRDSSQNVIPNTNTSQGGSDVALTTQTNGHGQITGEITLQPGFAARFPSVGTVYVEVFASTTNAVLGGASTVNNAISLGLSNAINLTGTGAGYVMAYNNVFNPMKGQQATIKYSTSGSGRMVLTIYTVLGERVTTLFDGQVPEGMGSINWNGRNSRGNLVASGVYIVRAQGPGVDDTQKIVVIK